MERFPTTVGKWDLVRAIGGRLGLDADHKTILAVAEKHFSGGDQDVALRESADLPGLAAHTYISKTDHHPDPPHHCNGLPTDFPDPTGTECSRRDLSLIVSAPTTKFQHDTLKHIGFAPEQVVTVEDFHAVRADRLLATADLGDMPHPAFKGADWALGFLRSTLRCSEPAGRPQKLYFSRATGRRVRNEDALMELLRLHGYKSVRLTTLSVAEQSWAVANASHIAGLHGADFANLAFAQPGTQIIEIFPEHYGTPAYYVIAAALRCRYATYVARGPVGNQSERAQAHDVILDLDHFARACRDIL